MFFCSRRFIRKAVCCVRFTARGQVRSRRAGFGLSEISSIASRTAFVSLRGGKSRLPETWRRITRSVRMKRHPVRVEFGLVSGFAHQVPYAVVGKEKSPYLLLDQFWLAGAQGVIPGPRCVGLELIEHKLRLPALMISHSKFGSRDFIRVCDIGDQGYDLVAVSPVAGSRNRRPVRRIQENRLSSPVRDEAGTRFLAFSFESAMNER